MIIKSLASEFAQNPKAGAAVAGATVMAGVGEILNIIPDDIGKLATLLGIVLTAVLIYTHLCKGRVEREKTKLEIELLKTKLKEVAKDVE